MFCLICSIGEVLGYYVLGRVWVGCDVVVAFVVEVDY